MQKLIIVAAGCLRIIQRGWIARSRSVVKRKEYYFAVNAVSLRNALG